MTGDVTLWLEEELTGLPFGEHGRLLARHTSFDTPAPPPRDEVLDGNGKTVLSEHLGHYDCFNHFLRVDGADSLYFLRGQPPDGHDNKELVEITASGDVRRVCNWDNQQRHLMNGFACKVDAGFVRAYEIYDPDPGTCLGRIDLLQPNGQTLWALDTGALATALLPVPKGRCAYALTDGRLGVLQVASGSVEYEERQRVDGMSTVVTALSFGERLLAGTVDGRLLAYSVR